MSSKLTMDETNRCCRCTRPGFPRVDPRSIYLGRYCDRHYVVRLDELDPSYLAYGPEPGEGGDGDEDPELALMNRGW